MATEGGVLETPVPDTERVAGELGALLNRDKVPNTLPALAGAKATLKVVLCPGLSVKGTVSPLVEKPLPVTVT